MKRSAVLLTAILPACSGAQSTLDPAGSGAEKIAQLFWVMLAGAAVIWLVVIGTAIFAGWLKRKPLRVRTGLKLIIWGGVILPTILLAVLLAYGLRLMPELRATSGDLRIEVTGERFWWRVAYVAADGSRVASANEVRMPAGATVELVLGSPDVIHSFWIPALGGKVDMIPGRTTRLTLRPTREGVYRGACAEFCGSSHALMAMTAVVMAPDEFETWLAGQAGPATDAAHPGRRVFEANGCGACHTVRGTEADGVVGPDLTHVGGRLSIGAGILQPTAADVRRFVANVEEIKPSVRMPSFGMLPPEDLDVLADYLVGLE
jgi:cytochrome c oxidase subunit 2